MKFFCRLPEFFLSFLWLPITSRFSELSYLETSIKESRDEAKVALSDKAYLRHIDAGCRRIAGLGSEKDGAQEFENDTGTVLFLYQELSAG